MKIVQKGPIMKTIILALSVCMLAVPVLSKQMEPNVELIEGDNRIDIMISGRLFTSYVYGSELTKPVLAPVRTPSGIEANRKHPLGRTPPRWLNVGASTPGYQPTLLNWSRTVAARGVKCLWSEVS